MFTGFLYVIFREIFVALFFKTCDIFAVDRMGSTAKTEENYENENGTPHTYPRAQIR